jgi:hypothetical protein
MTFDAKPRTAEMDAVEAASHNRPQNTFAQNLATGVAGSAAQSLTTLGKLGNKIPGVEYVSDKIGDLLGLPKLPASVNPYDVVQKSVTKNLAPVEHTWGGITGVGLEGLGEFITGDAALKGLSVGERMMQAAKATKILEDYPFLANLAQNARATKVAEAAGNIARTSALGAGQAALHGEDVTRGAEFGAAGGAAGEALGAGARALFPKTKVAADQAARIALAEKEIAKLDTTGSIDTMAGLASKAATGTDSEAFNFADAAKEIKDHFEPTYDKLREATGGVWNEQTGQYGPNAFDDAVKQVKDAKKVIYSPIPPSMADRAAAEAAITEGKNKLIAMSADSPEYAQAQVGWRKASILEDLHNVIDKASGVPSDVQNANLQRIADTVEAGGGTATMDVNPDDILAKVDPKKYVSQVNKAFTKIGSDDLRLALGQDAYDKLLDVRSGLSRTLNDAKYADAVNRLTNNYLKEKGGSTVNKAIGTPIYGAGAGYIAHVLGATNPLTAGVVVASAAMHYLYTHPDIAVPILKAAALIAPPAIAQGARAMGMTQPTHKYDPKANGGKGGLVLSDVYANDPSFLMGAESTPEEKSARGMWNAYPDNQKLADHVIALEGNSDVARRNANPGNLKNPVTGEFQKFKTPEEGRQALIRQLQLWRQNHPEWTVHQFNANYAPDASVGGDNANGTVARRDAYLATNAATQ